MIINSDLKTRERSLSLSITLAKCKSRERSFALLRLDHRARHVALFIHYAGMLAESDYHANNTCSWQCYHVALFTHYVEP